MEQQNRREGGNFMNYWGEVDYDCTIKSAWCDILVLGTYMEKARVDLTIVQHNGKMGLIQTEYGYLDDEEVGWLHDFVVACDYDEVDFLRTALGVFLLVNNEGKQGVLSLTAADTDKNWTIVNKKDTIFKYIFWERLDSLPLPESCFHFVWCQIA